MGGGTRELNRSIKIEEYLKVLKHLRHGRVIVQRLHLVCLLQLIRVLRFRLLALLRLYSHVHPLLLDLNREKLCSTFNRRPRTNDNWECLLVHKGGSI